MGLKKVVLRFWFVRSIVMLVVRMGRESRRSIVVIRIVYMNRGVWY